MPWLNGGGSTTELLVDPPGATLQTGFRWRLSQAGLEQSGPFSRFDGYDRTLLLLTGRGVRLDHGPQGRVLLAQPLDACVFPGEWETQGVLVDGPCRDFNVMSARSQVRHEVYVLRLGPTLTPLPNGPEVLVFAVSGRVGVPALGEILEPEELLRLDDTAGVGAVGMVPGTAVIVVVIHDRVESRS